MNLDQFSQRMQGLIDGEGDRERLTAMRVLGAVGEPWAGDILQNAKRLSLPDPIREECERALARLARDDSNR